MQDAENEEWSLQSQAKRTERVAPCPFHSPIEWVPPRCRTEEGETNQPHGPATAVSAAVPLPPCPCVNAALLPSVSSSASQFSNCRRDRSWRKSRTQRAGFGKSRLQNTRHSNRAAHSTAGELSSGCSKKAGMECNDTAEKRSPKTERKTGNSRREGIRDSQATAFPYPLHIHSTVRMLSVGGCSPALAPHPAAIRYSYHAIWILQYRSHEGTPSISWSREKTPHLTNPALRSW